MPIAQVAVNAGLRRMVESGKYVQRTVQLVKILPRKMDYRMRIN